MERDTVPLRPPSRRPPPEPADPTRVNDSAPEPAPCCPPPEPAPAVPRDPHEADAQLAALCRALGHPARVAILRLLMRRSQCVCGEIVDELPLSQSTVSQHLKQLKAAGLIRGEVDGPRVCYCINPGRVVLLRALVGAL